MERGAKTYTVRSTSSTAPYLVEPSKQQEQGNSTQQQGNLRRVVYNSQPGPVQTPRVARVLPPPQSAPQASRNVLSTPGNSASKARFDFDFADTRRSVDKSKGLRHFSTKVCEKVKEKGRTNYNEVADELVSEYFDAQSSLQLNDEKHQYDMKNIRRRVYDALNVLLAMNIIEKNKKDIHWVGLPTSTVQEFKRLEEDKLKRQQRIRDKTESLQEMIIQLVAYKSLVEKNREREREEGRPIDNSVLYLPYVIVNTEKRAMVECSVAHDKSEFLFNFDQPFEIHDDVEVLKRLGMAHGLEQGEVHPEAAEKVKNCLPVALRGYVDQIAKGTLHVTQRDSSKPQQYVIQKTEAEKTVEHDSSSRVQQVQAPMLKSGFTPQRTYTVVNKPSDRASPAKRYQAVTVRQVNGVQRTVLQSSPAPSMQPQVGRQEPQFRQTVGQNHFNGHYAQEGERVESFEMFDVEGEENLDYV